MYLRPMAAAIVGAALAVASFDASAQTLRYRWVDDNGSIRVADRIPPEASGKRIEVLNHRGIVVRVIDAALTPAERAALATRQAEEREVRRAQEAQAQRDRMLLATYTSVADLERARDTRLSLLTAQVTVSRDAAENLRKNVEHLEERVARLETGGETVPVPLANQLEAARRQYEATLRFIESREQEEADIREQFEADISRYATLRGMNGSNGSR